jgi:glycosyltransferase involved in cell wall biosynthesis
MKILVYTKGVAIEGGGGRRVFMELVKNFNRLGIYAYSWSFLPLFPSTLYDGKYQFDAYSYFDNWNVDLALLDIPAKEKMLNAFLKNIADKQPTHILFDTEYSFREFMKISEGLIETKSLPPFALLMHDQLWNENITYLTAFTKNTKAEFLAMRSPYPKLNNYIYSLLREIQGKYSLGAVDRPDSINSKAAFKVKKLALSYFRKIRDNLHMIYRHITMGMFRRLSGKNYIFVDNKDLERIQKIKQDVQKVCAIFCLTERSADETTAAYDINREKVIAVFGFYDPEDKIVLSQSDHKNFLDKQNKKILLAFSRLSSEKNIELILLAFAEAYKTYPDMELWIAGLVTEENKHYENDLVKLSEILGIGRATRFIGTVTDNEMVKIYQRANAFICAQTADFNISVYYALRFFKPVIVSAAYDFPMALKNADFILKDNFTVSDYARSILTVMNKKYIFGENEKNKIFSYTYENYASIILDKLKQIPSSYLS